MSISNPFGPLPGTPPRGSFPFSVCTLTWYDPALGGINTTGPANPHAKTSSGQPYDPNAFTCAAPPAFAFGTIITFSYNNTSCTCLVNDRGGAIQGSHFDLSRAAATALGIISAGMVQATYQVQPRGTPTSGPTRTAGGTANLGGTGTQTNSISTTGSGFAVGDVTNPDEDFWTAINRLAQARYWYSLAIDTPVPTPSGWTTMGALQVGDEVFSTDGHPTRVLHVFPVQYGHDCFRISFKDGSSIVADAEHPWETLSHYKDNATNRCVGPSRRWLGTRTTRELSESVFVTNQRKYNHQIPVAQPLALSEARLPIDPYIFGYWLGDGSKTNPRITVGRNDRVHLLAELSRASLAVTNDQRGRGAGGLTDEDRGSQLHLTTGVRGDLPKRLRGLGVYDNKHIPSVYLRASSAQRLALLQGLMDSDGAVGNRRALFANVNTRLADDVRELLRTFGLRAYRYVRRGGWQVTMPRGHVSTAADIVSVACATTPGLPLFRLPRKAMAYDREIRKIRGTQHYNCHTITAVEPVPSVPVRCVEVAATSHLFLVGEAMVPTHNCFSDSETLYLADGPDLMKQTPALEIDRIADAGRISHLDLTYDNTAWSYSATHHKRHRIQHRTGLAKVTSPVEGILDVICKIDECRAGDVVSMFNCGPGDGQWLAGDVRRSVFEVKSEVTLVQALTPLTEGQLNPAGVNPNNSIFSSLVAGVGTGNYKGYANPVGAWNPGRIDQGVDGTLNSNYLAPAPSIIGPIQGHGWPGGTYISGTITSGPLKGKAWYVAEGVSPLVSAGSNVAAGQPVARPSTGLDGTSPNGLIETGWADPSNTSSTLAQGLGSHDDQSAISIACGNSFNRLLVKLGAKPGSVQGRGVGVVPASLPGGYP